MRRPDGVSLIAIWHFFVAVCFLIGLCAIPIPLVAIWSSGGDADAVIVPTVAILFGALVIVILGAAFAIVGWGLWRLKDWGRVAAIVLAILQLLGFPIGTIIGIITLWYLLADDDAKAAFQTA